jgi:glutaredoxin-dependent peroxiredoxin
MEVDEAIRKRRALRSLDPRPIEEEKMMALVEAARLSASCFNNQPWRFIFCKSPETLSVLRSALPKGNAWANRAPLIIVVSAKEKDDCQLSDGRDYYLFDCGLSVGQMVLRATELGFVAHPIAGYDSSKVKSTLGIPADHVTITLIICGYHGSDDSLLSDKQKASESSRPERKPLTDNFFKDAWGRPFV